MAIGLGNLAGKTLDKHWKLFRFPSDFAAIFQPPFRASSSA
jgi:hypothetical protein